MCGIAGFVERCSAAEGRERLGAMLDIIRHRGPDGEGRLLEETLGLFAGMRRLSIIDLAGGGQPISNENGDVAVLFNGEIYNFLELRENLERLGHVFQTHSDTEVLVHLYEEHGREMLGRLRGMFGFMLLDKRAGKLLLARDPFGQKPFYFTTWQNNFAFASEVKSLFVLPWVDRSTNPDSLLDFLSWFSIPAPATHFHNIRKLPPGHWMEVELDCPGQAPRIGQYWKFVALDDPNLEAPDKAVEAVSTALDDSMRMHLRSDVPVGVLLSSGLDSNIVGTWAAGIHPDGLDTFTAGYADDGSEFEGARVTANRMGARHHEITITASDFEQDLERVAWHLDEPVADAAAFAVRRVCEYARTKVKVLLSGEGADELFAGYAERYFGMLQQIARSEKIRRFAPILPPPWCAFPRSSLGRMLTVARQSAHARLAALRIEGFPGDVRNPIGLTSVQLARLARRIEELGSTQVRPQRDPLHTMLAFDIDWQLAESLLLKADKMSMAASIELRTPFLDVPLADIAARIPSALKLRDGVGKWILRKTLAQRVPSESIERPKKGFPIPVDAWLRGPLCNRAYEEIFARDAVWRDTLDAGLLKSAWSSFLGGSDGIGRTFYALWIYEKWCRCVRSAPSTK